jgi:hypothetical protein
MVVGQRRARHDDSLAAAVVEVVDAVQHPVPTSAVRLMLLDGGRSVTAEQLGRLAAYERHDFARTRMPPRLCSAIDPSGVALNPRWWVRGDWRLERRILTPDAVPGSLVVLAVHLCRYHADAGRSASQELIAYTVGLANQVIDPGQIDTPASTNDWMNLHARIYGLYLGVLSNLSGTTGGQEDAAEQLRSQTLSGSELLFGVGAAA